ncbi:hypothetical protein MUK42_36505 [Musa troglodytarum]|uniref:Uncharacterized protein n=1 Tax=Musa troglodytarum TaxID=320322 RepID=A0A9E7KLR6_9LILI|nr:hypothetical protein MUK42_36505 [Musa troglodytarum]
MVKSNGDKVVEGIKEMHGMEVIVSVLVSSDSKVSTRGKSKAKPLLRVLESR